MKRIVIALVLFAGITAVAFASFSSARKKSPAGKMKNGCDQKAKCSHTCPYSL